MKKLTPKFCGKIDELGKMHVYELVKFKQFLMGLKGEVEIIVQKKSNRKDRSNNQNAYYFGVVLPLIGDYMGDDIESAHEAMKLMFLLDHTKKIKTTKRTSKLLTVEFEEYLSKIRIYMAREHDVFIPKPNEVLF